MKANYYRLLYTQTQNHIGSPIATETECDGRRVSDRTGIQRGSQLLHKEIQSVVLFLHASGNQDREPKEQEAPFVVRRHPREQRQRNLRSFLGNFQHKPFRSRKRMFFSTFATSGATTDSREPQIHEEIVLPATLSQRQHERTTNRKSGGCNCRDTSYKTNGLGIS